MVKTLLREIKDLNKRRDMPCSEIEIIIIIKLSILSKLIYRFNPIPIKIPAGL